MDRLQEILKKHLGTTYQESKSTEELLQYKIDSYNSKSGDLEGYDCPICKNKGHMLMNIDGHETYRECECIQIRRSNKLIEKSGLKELMDKFTFDRYKAEALWQNAVKADAMTYAENPEGWLYMCGQVGSGKTHLCTAVTGELLKRGIPALYMLWRSDATRIKASITDEEKYQKLLRPFKEIRCLYVDDLFKGKLTDADINLAFELLDHRYRNNMLTIISSEKSYKDLMVIDEAIASRIYEKCKSNYIWIQQNESKNYRLREDRSN